MGLVIGLIYSHSESWIAGSYYIQNLVSALGSLQERPQLKIFSEKQSEFEELKKISGYPTMMWIPLIDQNTIRDRIINKIYYTLFKKHFIARGIDINVDILYPSSNYYLIENIENKLIWIPDFQERHYPNLFSTIDLEKRRAFQSWVVQNNYPIVFSSNDSANDFKTFYPNAVNKIFVMPFAVTLPDLKGIQIDQLREKYNLQGEYFICSNQFWAHKNHKVVLEALLQMDEDMHKVKLVFTGKPYDQRNPAYYSSLIRFVEEKKLEGRTTFLGFIDRAEQLVLMKNSLAAIQPSLFEGWSTVVEDAKALGVPVIVSDIPVHREQLTDTKLFFEKDNPGQLAEKMKEVRINRPLHNNEQYGKKYKGIRRNLYEDYKSNL